MQARNFREISGLTWRSELEKEDFLYLGLAMEAISEADIRVRIGRDNPWWATADYTAIEATHPRRVYFPSFKSAVLNFDVKRAVVLLGPRRVGKTFMLKQLIHEAIETGIDRRAILYAGIDAPIYSGISLEQFLDFMPPLPKNAKKLVVFDEIQYLREWERHLKDLIDNYPNIKFVASGSAAAALLLKSRESGAGRFSDFMLPPLTFYEFLNFLGEAEKYIGVPSTEEERQNATAGRYFIRDVRLLNSRFIDYLNYGGYPEAVLNEDIRKNPEQFIKNDIIDKVLLKDLPSLYGINQIQELNRLFSFLAYNTGNEASLENIAQESGITKPTIKRYIEYLESAFLIMKLPMIDDNCRTMKRARNFKIYLNNPSMRAALFAPVKPEDSDKIGHLAESAIFSQWQHSPRFRDLRYARWRNEGEVDVVMLGPNQKPLWIGEIKWSDRIDRNPYDEMRSMQLLAKKHKTIKTAFFTSRTAEKILPLDGLAVRIIPSAAYCYTVGRNVTRALETMGGMPQPGLAEVKAA